MFNTDFQDCYVHLDESTLTIGNDRMERTWDMTGPRPAVRSMVDKETGRKWLTEKQESQWEEWPEDTYAFYRAGITEGKMKITSAMNILSTGFIPCRGSVSRRVLVPLL